MTSPYINTILYTTIHVFPNQLNNKLLTNIKKNIIEKIENKCYKQYGYISKIYKINNPVDDGIIDAENLNSSVKFNVSFSCKLCIPLKNQYLICKIDKSNQMLTRVSNGPIRVIITNDRINKDNFRIIKSGIHYIKNNEIQNLLKPGDHVKIKIESIKFNDKDNIIMCIGILENIASKEEVVLFLTDEHNENTEFVELNKNI